MSLSIAWPDSGKIELRKSPKERKGVVEKPYQTVYKNNTQNRAGYLVPPEHRVGRARTSRAGKLHLTRG
jgi:hypothetical protein